MRFVFALCLLTLLGTVMHAQSTAYVFKGGLSVGLQKWDNSVTREPLFTYHGALAVESVNNENDNASLYAQLGYHVRGSAIRFRVNNINTGLPLSTISQGFEFRNIALQVGAKQKHDFGATSKYYYFGGLRGEYHLNSNLGNTTNLVLCRQGAYPLAGGERDWLFGLSVGGGLQFEFSELVGGQIELSVNPDLTIQYYNPPIGNLLDCNGQPYNISERRIRNTTIEVSLGLRLLRKVVYID